MELKWIKEKNVEDNARATVQNFLDLLGIKVAKSSVKQALEANPEYPSLASLTDVLAEYNVDHLAVRLDWNDLKDVEFPAIAHLEAETPEQPMDQSKKRETGKSKRNKTPLFVVVLKADQNGVELLDSKHGRTHMKKGDFILRWSGVMLLAQKGPASGDPHFAYVTKKERLAKWRNAALLTLPLLLVLATTFLEYKSIPNSFSVFATLLLKGIGLALSIGLVQQSFGKPTQILKKMCQLGSGDENTCQDEVLSSKAAQLFSWLSLAEIGTLYFAGSGLSICLGILLGDVAPIMSILFVFSLIAIPGTLYSLYYQGIKIKKWCIPCTMVQAIIWMEIAVGYFSWDLPSTLPAWESVMLISWGFALPVIAWMQIKSDFGAKKNSQRLAMQVLKLRRNPALIEDALQSGRKVDTRLNDFEITLGNPEAPNTLIAFTHPFCGPCKDFHEELPSLINSAGEHLRIILRLPYVGNEMTFSEYEDRVNEHINSVTDKKEREQLLDKYGKTESEQRKNHNEMVSNSQLRVKISQTLLGLYKSGDFELAEHAADEWYLHNDKSQQGIIDWLHRYQLPHVQMEEMRSLLKSHQKWANQHEITATPSFFLNGNEWNRDAVLAEDLIYYLKFGNSQRG